MVLNRSAGSNRRIILAAFGWLILCANHPDPKRGPEQAQTDARVGDALTNIARLYDEQSKRPQSADEKTEPCGERQYGNNADLCAQWKAADAAADSAWWTWASGVGGIISLFGVVTALGLALWSNWIAKDTARRQLRAYMAAEEACSPSDPASHGSVVPRIVWKNGGETPAKRTIGASAWREMATGLPDDFRFPITAINLSGPLVVGPGATFVATASTSIPQDVMLRVSRKTTRVFLWGWVEYSDIFWCDSARWVWKPTSPRRRTEYAAEMCVTAIGRNWNVTFVPVWRHNGMDEDCLDDPNKRD